MTPADLRTLADSIPDLGHGGREIADTLIRLARGVKSEQAIVDIGPYLGSTTAYLAIGAGPRVPIHAYDTWDATTPTMREKARQYHGLELANDFRPLFLKYVTPVLGERLLVTHQGNIFDASYSGPPIALLVDDIGCDEKHMRAKLATFGPHLAPGAMLVLMDFYWYESKPGEAFDYQRRLVERNPGAFRFCERDGLAAVFAWGGGSVAY